jgi:hypothetical protein
VRTQLGHCTCGASRTRHHRMVTPPKAMQQPCL